MTRPDDDRRVRGPGAALRPDYRDVAIEELAISEAVLLERVSSLEANVATYRALTCAAFDALHDLTVAHDQLRARHHRMRDEYRHLLAQQISRQAVA